MNFVSSFFKDILDLLFQFTGNYGWAVVLFTLFVRLVLLPLDIKQKKSMRSMTRLNPQIQALQKKYGNDREKLNLKMNELYKREKVSPMSGCLPLFIQLPILWFVFAAMRTVANEHTVQMILDIAAQIKSGISPENVEVPLQSWLWIKNVFQPDSFMHSILPAAESALNGISAVAGSSVLTEANIQAATEFLTTDAYRTVAQLFGATNFIVFPINFIFFNINLTIPSSLAALGNSVNGYFILPVLAGVSQYLMSKLSGIKQNSDKNTPKDPNDPANAMNNGFFKWFFPLFSVYICATYNSAFSIYWMAVNVIQIISQFIINWYLDRKEKLQELKSADQQ